MLMRESAELKETHLGPLSNTFGRSPSTSTITDKDEKLAAPPTSSSTPAPPDNAIGTSPARHPPLRRLHAIQGLLLTLLSASSRLGSHGPTARRQGPQTRHPRCNTPRGPELLPPRATPPSLPAGLTSRLAIIQRDRLRTTWLAGRARLLCQRPAANLGRRLLGHPLQPRPNLEQIPALRFARFR